MRILINSRHIPSPIQSSIFFTLNTLRSFDQLVIYKQLALCVCELEMRICDWSLLFCLFSSAGLRTALSAMEGSGISVEILKVRHCSWRLVCDFAVEVMLIFSVEWSLVILRKIAKIKKDDNTVAAHHQTVSMLWKYCYYFLFLPFSVFMPISSVINFFFIYIFFWFYEHF